MTVADLHPSASARWSAFRQPSAVAVGSIALAVPFVLYLLQAADRPLVLWELPVFFAAFLVAERLTLAVEVRSHTFTCSVGEVVLVVALVEMGGAWTTAHLAVLQA